MMGKSLNQGKQMTQKISVFFTGIVLIIMTVFLVSGCTTSVGPKTIARDRYDYISAISESWKRQTLLNLLKTRYMDAPVFMDIASVINQYTLEGQMNLGASVGTFDSLSIGGSGRYTDRPTITFNPLKGEKFTESMMSPIPIMGILNLIQAGYPADYVLRICANTISGHRNHYGGPESSYIGDKNFNDLLIYIRDVQKMGGLGMRVKTHNERESIVMFFRKSSDQFIKEKTKKIRELLALSQDTNEFYVVYGEAASNDREIAILSRSMLQVMVEYASYIDVPKSDIIEGRVSRTAQGVETSDARFKYLIHVKTDIKEPEDVYVSVSYRGHWFWIDDRDFHSKQLFYFMMLLFSLTERGGDQAAPIITIPTN